jgi:hypothetical protein
MSYTPEARTISSPGRALATAALSSAVLVTPTTRAVAVRGNASLTETRLCLVSFRRPAGTFHSRRLEVSSWRGDTHRTRPGDHLSRTAWYTDGM